MFCKNCGKEVNDNAVVCVHCGCAIAQPATGTANKSNGLSIAIKIFMILGCIAAPLTFFTSVGVYWGILVTLLVSLIPLCWTIPMTVHAFRKLNRNEPIGTGFKVCTLLFCSLVAGILLLCRNENACY